MDGGPQHPKNGYFLVGMGGVGMSALAEWLHGAGVPVAGSDRNPDQASLEALSASGVCLYAQDGSGLHPGQTLVYSTAIEGDNPDWMRAQSLGLRVLHRAQCIAHCAEGHRVIAIAGTAGKTSMTALLGWVLTQAGLDPDVINGGVLLDWKAEHRLGASRNGKGDWMVLEADESDRSFLNLSPDWAVISNLGADHFSLEETVQLFRQFASRVKAGLVLGPGVRELLCRDGIPWTSLLQILNVETGVCRDGELRLQGEVVPVPLPGMHNALNAALVMTLAQGLGVDLAILRDALRTFRGVHRRLERVGGVNGVEIYDDYAHNPMKMEAAIRTLQSRYSSLSVFWRPHGYRPLRLMMDDLSDLFPRLLRETDRLFLLPVYYAGGTADRSLDSDQLVRVLQERAAPVSFASDYAQLRNELRQRMRPGSAVLGMGARDPQIPEFLAGLTRDESL